MREKYRSTLLPQGAIVELIKVGGYIRANAVDPVTGAEVTIAGDPRSTPAHIKREAVKKLEYVLAKKRGLTRQTPADQSTAKTGVTKKRYDPHSITPRGKRKETPSGWDV